METKKNGDKGERCRSFCSKITTENALTQEARASSCHIREIIWLNEYWCTRAPY